MRRLRGRACPVVIRAELDACMIPQNEPFQIVDLEDWRRWMILMF